MFLRIGYIRVLLPIKDPKGCRALMYHRLTPFKSPGDPCHGLLDLVFCITNIGKNDLVV